MTTASASRIPRDSHLPKRPIASVVAKNAAGEKPRLCERPDGWASVLLLDRDQRGFCHRERRRLRHLQALRPVHAVGDPVVDLVEELVDEDVRRNLLEDTAMGVDEADVAAARDAEVCISRLPRSVDGAAKDGDLEVL